jgi:hypothetical protein
MKSRPVISSEREFEEWLVSVLESERQCLREKTAASGPEPTRWFVCTESNQDGGIGVSGNGPEGLSQKRNPPQ